MKQPKLTLAWNLRNVLIICAYIRVINGYPVTKKNIDKTELRDEKTYPNGTIVGKYFYEDKNGNPIHVKYYADDSGYGVELKSVKVISTSTADLINSSEQPKSSKCAIKTNENTDSTTSTFFPIYDHKKTNNPFEDLGKNVKSSNKYKSSPDYEIFVDNELKAPKKCGEDKVHVYFENKNRKARHSLNEFDALKYCEQFQFP